MIERIKTIAMIVGLAAGLYGCLGQTGGSSLIRYYVLEYTPPAQMKRAVVPAAVRVERFSASRLYNGSAMVYRDGAYRRGAPSAARWRIVPADMVTECLRRDLRKSGIFSVVLAPWDIGASRYSLEGEIEEFLEIRDGESRRACISVTVTFLDLYRPNRSGAKVFQKEYRVETTVSREGFAGLAEAMSLSMSKLSQALMADIEAAAMQPDPGAS